MNGFGDELLGPLADALMPDPDVAARTPQLRSGVVTQVSPLLVRVGSATTAQPCRAIGSYSPTVNDVVQVLVLEGDRVVLGTTGSAPTAGSVLWQHSEIVSFSSTMNGSEDFTYNDTAGAFGFPTIATMEVSALYMSPDRATFIHGLIYSNSYASPAGGGLIYAQSGVNAGGAGWNLIGAVAPAIQPTASNVGGPAWTLRLTGVQGGPTLYSARYHLLLRRFVA